MRIAVIGGGATGSLFAARLALAGEAVTLVEIDAARRAQIAQAGLLVDLAGASLRAKVRCVAPGQLGSGQDLLLLFTKFSALAPALAGAINALAPAGCVAVLSNGLGVERQLAGLIAPERLVLGVSDVAADLREGVAHSDGSGVVRLGMADPAAGQAPALAVVACLSRAGFAASAWPDIRPAIWEKLAFNAAFNAVATLTDACVRDLDNPPGRRIVVAVLAEVAVVAGAARIAFDAEAVAARIAMAFARQGGHRPSMAQDRRAGRPTEIDAINSAIADCADHLGVPAPINRTLADLVRLTGG